MKSGIFTALAKAAQTGESVALGIISGVKGSSPQKLGAKAVFYPDGRIAGTLGGGCLEAEIQQRAIQSLKSGRPAPFDLLLDHDFGWDDGLICGGKVEGVILPNAQRAGQNFWHELDQRKATIDWGVRRDFSLSRVTADVTDDAWIYRERVRPPCVFWIAGAGHIAQAVAPLAAQLDFAVTVFDDRPALLNHEFFPHEVELKADVWDRLLVTQLPPGPVFGLIVTRGHRHDALVLKTWIHQPFSFLGMIGSQRKARTIREHFLQDNIATNEDFKKLACPVGLPIRSTTVMEIAVSIMAQFIQQRALVCVS